jgi:hypothetical protein
LVTDVLSRPIDFVVAFALCAALGIVGLGTLAWNPQRESLPPLSRLGFVALGGAVVVAPLVGLWAVLTVSRLSDFDGSFALVPVATVPLSLWALWRQASGRRSASTLFASLLMLLTPPAVLAVIVLLRGSEETALPAAELAMLGAISACAVALYIAAGTPAVRRRS